MSVFTACTKEELNPQKEMQNAEFPGAKVIGTNVTADFTFGNDTKVDANGNWEDDDKFGLAWAPIVSAEWAQDSTTTVGDKLYANNMFFNQDGKFTTYGNIYEGWNFGYYPYARMNQTGEVKKVVVNPDQEATFTEDVYKTRLHLSAKQYLTEANVVDDKLVNGHFMLYRAVKTLKVNIAPEDDIKSNDVLNVLNIKSVEIEIGESGAAHFISDNVEMEIKPSVLGNVVYSVVEDSDPVEKYYDEEKTAENFYTKLNDMVASYQTLSHRSKKISTNVEKANFDLTGTQEIRFHLLPFGANAPYVVKTTDLTLKVNVDNGYFLVNYTPKEEGKELTSVEKANNETFEKLVALYTEPKTGDLPYVGYLRKFSAALDGEDGARWVGLDFTLTADMFHENFVIESEDAWNEAVAIVNEFGKEEVEFTIKQGATEATKWEFTKDIELPDAELTVKGDEIIMSKSGANWPCSEDFIVESDVVVKADLNVAGEMNVGEIINKATIYAGSQSVIDELDNSNENAKVVVEFGARVKTTAAGVMAYVVNEVSEENMGRINDLITLGTTSGTLGLTPVNTLIVDGVSLDLNATAKSSDGNPYNPSGVDVLNELDNVAIVLVNGGRLEGNDATGKLYQVKKIIAMGGTANNRANTVEPLEGISVEAGTLVCVDAILDAETDIYVAQGAKLYLRGANNNSTMGALTVNGTVNVEQAGLTVKELVVAKTGNVKVSENSYLTWTEKSELKGTTSGEIAQAAKDKATLSALVLLAKDGETIYLGSDIELGVGESINFSADKNIILNLNGKKLENKKGDVLIVENGTLTIEGDGEVWGASDNDKPASAVWARGEGSVIINGGIFKVGDDNALRNDCIYAKENATIIINDGEFEYTGTHVDGDKFLLNVNDEHYKQSSSWDGTHNANIIVKGGKFHNFNPASTASENPVANFVAEGYKSVETATGSNIFKVVAK